MNEARVPPIAFVLSAGSLIPFLAASLGAVRSEASGGIVSIMALITWGAVMLAFLGGVHWGFVLEGPPGPAARSRLMLGVLPGIAGWGAALLGVLGQPSLGLAVLIAGFTATAMVETRAQVKGLVPGGYMAMRWIITVIVVALLTTVLVLRLIGAHLLF